jgi:alanine-synthesizing transaminase
MAGWRVGFAVGNKKLIAALTRVKSYLDYGAFTPIQAAACAALNGPQDIVEQNRQLYQKRRDVMVEASAARVGHSFAPSLDVRLGAAAPGARASGQPGIFQAVADRGRSRRGAGRGLWRGWRGLRAHRHGRERAAPAPGRAQHQALSASMGVNTPGSAKAV